MDPKAIAKTLTLSLAKGSVAPLVAAYKLETALIPKERHDPILQAYSQVIGMIPGLTGQFMRRAFYGSVLIECDPTSCINWATVFSSAEVSIRKGVYIGARCMIGRAVLEPHVTIGSNVDILSGKNQHNFDDASKPIQEQGGRFETVHVGTNTWIGNGAIVLADIGARSIVAAGSVVVSDLPDDVIVGGNPAKVLKKRDAETGAWVKP